MIRKTFAALFALGLCTVFGLQRAQAQSEEQQPSNAVSYNLPELVAQKGIENVYDAIGALPGISVQNGVLSPCSNLHFRRTSLANGHLSGL